MPVGTKVGAASSGGNIKLKDSIGKVVGPAEYTSTNFRLGSLSKTAWINRRDYGNQSSDGSTLVKESSPDSFYSYYSSGDADASDYQQDGSWSGGGPNSGINDNTPAGMGEFAGVQNDYFTVGTQLVGAGIPQRYIGFSPLTGNYKHAASARNDFGAGTSFQNYTISAYCRRNGDHLSIFVGATINGNVVGTNDTMPNRGFGALNTTIRPASIFTVPYGNTQPVDYNLHASTSNAEIAWYNGGSSETNPYANQKEIYRLENACASDGPTGESHSGGNGSGQNVSVQVFTPLTTVNVNNHPGLNQIVRRYVDNGTTSNFSLDATLMTSTNTVIGADIQTQGFMTDTGSNAATGFQSLGIVVPFLISIVGVGSVGPDFDKRGSNSGSSSTLNNQAYSGGQGVLQDNASGSHSTSDMIRTGYISQKLIMVGIRADSDKTSSGSPTTIQPGFNPGAGNIPLF